MARDVQYMPAGYNFWQGNQFQIPGVPNPQRQLPLTSPLYAEAVQQAGDQSVSPEMRGLLFNAAGDSGNNVDPGGYGSKGPTGNAAGTQQATREATSFGDLAASVLTGAPAILGPVGLVSTIMGQRDKMASDPISLRDAIAGLVPGGGFLSGLFDGGGYEGSGTLGSPDNPGPGSPSTPDNGDGPNPFGAPDGTQGADLNTPDPGLEGSGATYRTGGMIPTDGDAQLEPVPVTAHEGEFVMRPESVKKYGRGLFSALNAGKVDKKKLRGLLG